jgi:hypothetical protein
MQTALIDHRRVSDDLFDLGQVWISKGGGSAGANDYRNKYLLGA